MLSPRWRKVLGDLWKYKTRSALVVLSTAVGVFAVGMITGTQVTLSRELTNSYLSANPADATLYVEPFDEDLVRSVRGVRGVQEVEGRRSLTVQARVGTDEWRTLQLLAIPNFADIQLNQVTSERGAWPPSRGELLIERASLGVLPVNVGDAMVVETPDGKRREMQVGGVVHDRTQAPAFFTGRASGYVTFGTLEWLGAPRNYNELNIGATGRLRDKKRNQQIANQVQDKVEKAGYTVFYTYVPDPGKHPVDNAIQVFLYVLGALGLLSLLLSGFLVFSTVSSLLSEQIRQIGVMKAIGAGRHQIVEMYLAMIFALALLSLGLGMPLGWLGAYAVSSYVSALINFDIVSFTIPPHVFALEFAVGLFVPVLAALHPIATGTRLTIREALGNFGLGSRVTGVSLLERLLGRVHGVSRPLLLSLRNTFRRKGRLALTLTTLAFGGATFISVFSVRDSVLQTLDETSRYFNYDVEVRFARSYRVEQIEREALLVPGVAEAESMNVNAVRRLRRDGTESGNFFMMAMRAETSLIQPAILRGRWLLPQDENAVVVNTTLLKSEPDISPGDDMALMINGRKTTWRVVGIARGVATGPIAYANFPYFSRLVRRVDRASNVWIVTKGHNAEYQTQAAKLLEDHYRRLGLRPSGVETIAWTRSLAESQFNIVVVFLLIMAVLLAVVGGFGLAGTMSLNVLDRTREIGVMRAIGASSGAVRRMVIGEGVLIGILSWFAGVLISLWLSRILSDAVGMAFLEAPLSYRFSTDGALFWLAAIIALATLSSVIPALRASRLSVREALAYE